MSDTAVLVDQISKKYTIGATHGAHTFLRRVIRMTKRAATGTTGANREQELWALRDVSFDIKKGEVFGIIGANGSGKSTLLKILSRVTDPTKGRAVLTGRFCGLLEVGTGFHPELTGRDNIYMSGAILGMKRREIDRKFDEIVAFAEVEQFVDTPVKHYSSGMYVRLGFSVLAHMDPDILIVDEVLAVGDVRFQKKCMGKMEDVGQHGRTVILVSHDMQAITRLCRRALLLSGGEVVREGPACEIVSEYLSHAHLKPSCEWPDVQQAPGNEIVRMRGIHVKNETGMVRDAFDIRQSIAVEMEYDVLQAGCVCVAEFKFRNEEDLILFIVLDRDPEWHARPRPIGRYVSTTWIPGNLLSEGVVRVNAAIMTEDPFLLHASAADVVGFRIHETGAGPSARGTFTGRWPGAIRPLLTWTTEYCRDESLLLPK
ncbi:MAG: ABC transporter ATP-binding protein [Nitrospiraceae bacterium]